MIYAYYETYLDDAMNNLGDMFDYAVNDCGYDLQDFYDCFIVSGVAESFGCGNPKYVAGLSGIELALEVIYRTLGSRCEIPSSKIFDKSPEYWVGWALAYYQWYRNLSFFNMEKYGITMERMLSLYPTLHEADITKFVSVADYILKENVSNSISNLQLIRKANNITQKKLAEKSEVSLRMIQLYEQRERDINKAQVASLVNMAHALHCKIEDLLEINVSAFTPLF